MKTSFLFVLVFLVAGALYSQTALDQLLSRYNSHSIPYISVKELKSIQIDTDVVLLDVREAAEFEVSHIKGAVFLENSKFLNNFPESAKNKPGLIVVYCTLGIRSERYSEKLKAKGYNVRNLYGGIFEWKNNGFSVFNRDGKETEKVHVYSKHWAKWLTKGEKAY